MISTIPIFVAILLLSSTSLITYYQFKQQSPYNLTKNIPDLMKNKMNLLKCQRPPTTQQNAWNSKVFLCPYTNGSRKQCTNNYIPTYEKENCDPMNRTYEMCPYPYQISEKCYYRKTPIPKKSNIKVNGCHIGLRENPTNPYKPLHYKPLENPDSSKYIRNGIYYTKLYKKLLLKTPSDIPPTY